ncbi:MAG: hypothetical protein OEX00_09200, partial [Gammaproteobacteria bacterium]|nr:hypothetical protein [Gammaproteobacteria bacterium]
LLLDLGPQEMPEMTISANSFVFDGVSYGKLELDAKRESNGLRLNKLKMSSPDTQITAAGVWTEENKNQSSQFKIDAHTRNLGKLLEQSGFAGTIAGGLTDLAIQASWFGSPLDFSFDRLTGKVSMDVKGGRLLDVEPGAARVFGLLSIQTLPRRIFLDFRDVFAEGMAFDSVTGEFDIENGVAFTPGLVLDSPAVKVEMAGQVDLAEKLYDQVVTVTPKVGDSVPLITGILVTPAVGLTLFALNKLLGPQIDEISSLQYQVTGPWSNPTIAEVEKPKVELQDEVQE